MKRFYSLGFKVFNLLWVMLVMAFSIFASPVFAQEQIQKPAPQKSSKLFEAKARAVNPAILLAGKTRIYLWGVQPIEGMSAQFSVTARAELDNALGPEKVRCELKNRDPDDGVVAQCANASGLDLGLYMLQRGYAVVDRGAVYGSAFETPYIQAENVAQRQEVGVWSPIVSGGGDDDGSLLVILGGLLFLCVLAVFSVLTYTIMKGFKNVTEAQNQNTDMMARERALRDKEREIFATMLDSEIKVNKAKIEAYLVVYDEMLKDLNNPDKAPKYKQAGDIVQAQPALERSVFDRNTDKLDILGDTLSSEVIHFYARIKSKPDYINLEPDMAVEDACKIVEKAFHTAQRLDQISDRLIDMFASGGHALDDEEQDQDED